MRKIFSTIVLLVLILGEVAWSNDFPSTPPKIGNLKMPQIYWDWILASSKKYQISPYVVQGFMAIESRYNARAVSHKRCIGLMQLDFRVAKKLGVDPWKPDENIDGGARILSRLMRKHRGDLSKVARTYYGKNCPKAYIREVIKAIRQAQGRGK